MDTCEAILNSDLFPSLSVSDDTDFQEKLNTILQYSYDDLKTMSQEDAAKAGISIPVVDAILSFGGSDDEKRQEYESLREQFKAATTEDVRFKERFVLKKRMGISKDAINGWVECMRGKRGLSITTVGEDLASFEHPEIDFFLYISYNQQADTDKSELKITGVEFDPKKVRLVGDVNLKKGSGIHLIEGLVQRMQRLTPDAFDIIVSIQGREPQTARVDALPPPPPLMTVPSIEISSSTNKVAYGGTAVISWKSSNAVAVSIEPQVVQADRLTGQATIQITSKSRQHLKYTATATASSGERKIATVEIEVLPKACLYADLHRGGVSQDFYEGGELPSGLKLAVTCVEVFTAQWVILRGRSGGFGFPTSVCIKGPNYVDNLAAYNQLWNDMALEIDFSDTKPASGFGVGYIGG